MVNLVSLMVEKYIDKNYKTIDDLPASIVMDFTDKKAIESTKILIIDDDKITLEDTLRRIGYNVVWKKDIDILTDVEDYPIIVCDYKGVGLNFPNEFEGINLVRLIKEKYPEKIVYLLSAADFNPRANDYIKFADEMVYKGEEHKLVEFIKQDCAKIFNPKERWIQYKNLLMKKGIKEKEVFKLENLYVRSLLNQKDLLSYDPLFLKINANLNIKFDVRIGLINL